MRPSCSNTGDKRSWNYEQLHADWNGKPKYEVDKSVVVLGGFGDMQFEEAQHIQNHVMAGVDGFRDMHFSNNTPIITLADFESPMQAMKFIRGPATQRTHATCAVAGFGEPVHPGKAEVQDHQQIQKNHDWIGRGGA